MSDSTSAFGAFKNTPADASDIFGSSTSPVKLEAGVSRKNSDTFGASSSEADGSSAFEAYFSPKHAETAETAEAESHETTPPLLGGRVTGSTPTKPFNLLKLNSPISSKKVMVAGTEFIIPTRYELIKPIGHGAYGVVMYVHGPACGVVLLRVWRVFGGVCLYACIYVRTCVFAMCGRMYVYHISHVLVCMHTFFFFSCTHSACQDTTTNQRVAIKKVPKAFEDVVDAKRVSREIKLLRFMNHENVCRLSMCVCVCVPLSVLSVCHSRTCA